LTNARYSNKTSAIKIKYYLTLCTFKKNLEVKVDIRYGTAYARWELQWQQLLTTQTKAFGVITWVITVKWRPWK